MFPQLVLGRSPQISRPPTNFRLVYEGRYYDVWRRTSTPQVLQHVAIGGGVSPVAVPSCRLVMATAARATSEHARLAYVERDGSPTWLPTLGPGNVVDDPAETLTGTLAVKQPGRYQVWLEVSVIKRFAVTVAGQYIGSVSGELGPPGMFVHLGEVTLASGTQPIRIVPSGGALDPGSGTSQVIGPLMLSSGPDPPTVSQTDPSNARSLCGRSLDWLEIVR
jgi:hypothetical protein